MTPRVSVVTTVYNGEPYLDRAIPGILAQTFKISSGSWWTTARRIGRRQILRELAQRDSRVRVFSPGRLGIAKATNFGVTQARGEYIARQDFDDRSYPDRLRRPGGRPGLPIPRSGVVGGYYLLVD